MLSKREDSVLVSADVHLDDSNLLAAYFEDRLEAERRLVTEHLTSCDACRAAVAALARGSDDLAGVAPAESPPVVARRTRVLGLRPIAWLPVAAALAIATVSGIRLLRMQQPPASAPVTVTPDAAPVPVPVPLGQDVPGAATRLPVPPEAAPRSADPVNVDPSVLPRRSGERRIGAKTFRLVAGEWIDTAYDPVAGLQEVRTATPEETTALAQRVPALGAYIILGSRVLVVLDGTVYRLRGGSSR